MNKITITTALATVLNIQCTEDGKEYYRNSKGVMQPLGANLHNAIVQACDLVDGDEECCHVIFPEIPQRGALYMQVEAQMCAQEAAIESAMADKLTEKGDPREIINLLMLAMRDCATNVCVPQVFRTMILRVVCLGIASLQWCDGWIGALRMRDAVSKIVKPSQFDGNGGLQ